MTPQDTSALRDRVGSSPVPAAAGETAPTPESMLKHQIKQMQQSWANALPRTVTPERFVRTVLTEVSKNPSLAECDTVTFLGAVTAAAQLGLEFGPLGLAYLVPFYNARKRQKECQLIVGYKGYLQLARRSGDVKDIKAVAVHEADQFDYWEDEEGTHLMHRPAFENKGPVVRYYGRCTFTNGGSLVMVVSLADIEARKARSQSADKGFSPWQSDEEAMKLKTVVRIMIPWLPLATEVAQGLAGDEQVIRLKGTDIVVEQAPTIEAQAVAMAQATSPRGDLGEQIDTLLDSMPGAQAKAAQSYLVQHFGEASQQSEDQLRWIVAILVNWEKDKGSTPNPADASPQDAPSAPETGGVVPMGETDEPWDVGAPDDGYDGDPGLSAPQDSGHPPVQADPAMEERVKASLDAMPIAKLRETAGLFGVRVEGSKAALAMRLLPVLVGELQAGNPVAEDIL